MSEDLLKSRIEEIVHPIPAFDLRKNLFRRELYAHAYEHYTRFLEQGVDSASAVTKAVEQLGEPAQLRQDLMDNISRIEQWSYDYENVTGPGRLRAIAPITVPVMFLSAILGFSPVFLLGAAQGFDDGTVLSTGLLILAVYFCAMSIYASFAWLGTPIRETVRFKPIAWRRLAGIVAGHVVCFVALSLGLLFGLQRVLVLLDYPYHEILWAANIAAPTLMLFVEFTAMSTLIYIVIRERQTSEHIPDWPYIED